MDLALHIEQLPDGVNKTHVKIGSHSQKLVHVQSFEGVPSEAELLDCLERYGYGSEYTHARILWYENSKQCKSYSINTSLASSHDDVTELRCMIDGYQAMAAENRRMSGSLVPVVEHLTKALIKSQNRSFELQEEVIEERTTALALDLAIQSAEKEQDGSYKERAFETLAKLAEGYMSQKQQFTASQLKSLVKEHPEIIDQLMNDEEIVSIVTNKILAPSK